MYVYAEGGYSVNQYDTMLDAALTSYEELYKIDKSYQETIVDLRKRKGWRYIVKSQCDDAINILESAYALNEQTVSSYLSHAYNQKAYDYVQNEDYDDALSVIEKAIALMPEVADYYDSKGEILLKLGDAQGALEMWHKVLELEPEFLSSFPEGTELYNGLKQKGLITEE